MDISPNKKNKEMNEPILEIKQHCVKLNSEKEIKQIRKAKRDKERRRGIIIFFIPTFFYLLFTIADIIIQYKNHIGKNNLLIDDFVFISGLIIIIISLKFGKVYYCYIFYHCLSILEYIVNDIIFFVFYIKKYKKSRHVFNFFISFCVIKFFGSCFLLMIYEILFGEILMIYF